MNHPRSLHHLQRLSDEHGMKVKHLNMKAWSKNVLLYHKACRHKESGEENSSTSECETANETTSFMFANRSEEDKLYPLMVLAIVDKKYRYSPFKYMLMLGI